LKIRPLIFSNFIYLIVHSSNRKQTFFEDFFNKKT